MNWYSRYDEIIEKVCPGYIHGIGAVAGSIRQDAKRILELGCGTGNLTCRLAQCYPNSEILAIDQNEDMIRIATEKTSAYANVEVLQACIPEINFCGYDAVASSLLIHLLQSDDKKKIIRSITDSPDTREIVIFDKVGFNDLFGNTKLYHLVNYYFFLKQSELERSLVDEIFAEACNSDPVSLDTFRYEFENKGFDFDILYENHDHPFVAFRGRR